jgi:hypothetical protein
MKTTYVLPTSHFRARPPILLTAVVWLLLDRFAVPGWAWGVFYTLNTSLWIVWLIAVLHQEDKPLDGYGGGKP